MNDEKQRLSAEVARRRTFAIISHPDAGKTTLTEKLLLYGGAIHLAGAVRQGHGGRATTSDWMAVERERGISISTSVMQFQYGDRHLNLLDTPGHNDFSEDTYRTLAAADAAVMLIDSVKGVEPQTIKLFEVCRLRGIPIVTFVNKLDRQGRPPLDLLDEIESVLGIPCSPVHWPIGAGSGFLGVYDRWSRQIFRFERAEAGARRAPMTVASLEGDPTLVAALGSHAHAQLVEDLELLEVAGNPFDRERFLAGGVTPVFFGSAMNNFGVEPFLERFVELAPSPRPRAGTAGVVAPDGDGFSAFVFKIQANMDPQHRDRIAFLRICSGRFVRGMEARHARTGKLLTLNKSLQVLAQERTQVEEAFAGDVIGLWDPGILRLGDTLCTGPAFDFEGIPRFSPEHFVRVRLADPLKRKQYRKGMEQLADEGAVQLFYDRKRSEVDPILGVVGVLQLEVFQHRLRAEYGVDVSFDRLPYQHARWVEGEGFSPATFARSASTACIEDIEGRPVVLFETDWVLHRATTENPGLRFLSAVQPGRSPRGR
ncbi:peptide chain release factor 3 [Myxococcota bacterium]|nr:peptide chain release factor 3 [Myxococcota bacterium]